MDIKKELRNFLKKNESLYYLQRVIRRAGNEEYRKKVMRVDGVRSWNVEKLGNKNKGKVFLLFNDEEIFGGRAGFFAIYGAMIHTCRFAELFGLVPYFVFGKNNLYYSKEFINGTRDAFGHYFNQYANVAYEDVLDSFAVIKMRGLSFPYWGKLDLLGKNADDEDLDNIGIGYSYSEEYFQGAGAIANSYLERNPIMADAMNWEIREKLGGHRVLGVHVRLNSFREVKNVGHPIAGNIDEYIKKVKSYIKEYRFEKIFLATLERETIELFQHHFGKEMLLYYDGVSRSRLGSEMIEGNPYKKGYEVMRDAYTLASCDGFIAGLSQVAFGVQIIRYAEKQRGFSCKYIFDQGIHRDGLSGLGVQKRVIEIEKSERRLYP